MRSFDKAAGSYESFGHIQREMAAWLAEWLPPTRSGTAIEVAAGTGMLTRHLTPWSGSLIATDASPNMVSRGQLNCPNADWRVGFADQLPDVPADWILSASFLQWATDPEVLLRHWKERLVAGGRILAGLFVRPTLQELYDVLPESTPLQWRTPAEWETILNTVGLRISRQETVECVFTFSSSIDLLRSLHGVGAAPARRVPAATLRRALHEYETRFRTGEFVRSTWMFYRFEAAAEGKRPMRMARYE